MKYIFSILIYVLAIFPNVSIAVDCVERQAECIEPGQQKLINNMPVYKACWKYKYNLECNVPSKNDCYTIPAENCDYAEKECLTTADIMGRNFCVNEEKKYVCQRKETYQVKKSELIHDPDNKQAAKELLCKFACIDGNCPEANKAGQEDNNEIASAIAGLEMLVGIKKGLIDASTDKFDVFNGDVKRCKRKITDYTNCCTDSGWGKDIGLASCKENETDIAKHWREGRCEFLGSHCDGKKILGHCVTKVRTYCCYQTVLGKIINRDGKKQFGRGLGTSKAPECGGLTIEELEKIDFGLIDFKEFFDREVLPRMKEFSSKDNEELMKRSFPQGKIPEARSTDNKFSGDTNNPGGNRDALLKGEQNVRD